MLARGANQPEVIRPDFYQAIRIDLPAGKITSDRALKVAAGLTAFANSDNVQMNIDTYTDRTVAWGGLAAKYPEVNCHRMQAVQNVFM